MHFLLYSVYYYCDGINLFLCEPSPRHCMYYICIFCTDYANAAPNRALCFLYIKVEVEVDAHAINVYTYQCPKCVTLK